MLLNRGPSWRQGSRPQPIDDVEDFSEQFPRHRHLGHDKQCILVIIGPDEIGRKELLVIADG